MMNLIRDSIQSVLEKDGRLYVTGSVLKPDVDLYLYGADGTSMDLEIKFPLRGEINKLKRKRKAILRQNWNQESLRTFLLENDCLLDPSISTSLLLQRLHLPTFRIVLKDSSKTPLSLRLLMEVMYTE
jgi:hypothetical protein